MTRNRGYIVLDKILKALNIDITSINSILRCSNISKFGNPSSGNFSFVSDNDRFFYKPYDLSVRDPYFELVSGYLLEDFGLKHVEYDLAMIEECKCYGVISKDFRIEGATYVTGEELLSNCFSDYVGRHNNLEDIWYALEKRYQNNPNKDKVVAYLMDKIVDLYIFDLFTGQSDRHPNNYQIVEIDGKVDLVPVYDNEEYGRMYGNVIKVDRYGSSQLNDNLSQFLEISDIRYLKRIQDKLWVLEEDNINKIFSKIESKITYPIPNDIKNKYIDFFEINRFKIIRAINKEVTKRR